MSTIAQIAGKIATTANKLKSEVISDFVVAESTHGHANYGVYSDRQNFKARLHMFPESYCNIEMEVDIYEQESYIRYTIGRVHNAFELWICMKDGQITSTRITVSAKFTYPTELKTFISSDRILILPAFSKLIQRLKRHSESVAIFMELTEDVLSVFVSLCSDCKYDLNYTLALVGDLKVSGAAKIAKPADVMFVDIPVEIV